MRSSIKNGLIATVLSAFALGGCLQGTEPEPEPASQAVEPQNEVESVGVSTNALKGGCPGAFNCLCGTATCINGVWTCVGNCGGGDPEAQ